MFVLRCLGVSLSFFLLLYGAVSVAVIGGWRSVRRAGGRLSPRRQADVLFLLRSLPLTAAAVGTLAFAVPSFLLLEPRAVTEPVGEIPLTLGAVCLSLFGIGLWNAISIQRRTSRMVSGWLEGSTAADRNSVPLFRIRRSTPALAVAGVRVPRVLLSDAAAALLNGRELETALRHEMVHVRRQDNLKKLLFRFCALPGMAGLEAAWSDSAEIAADDAAVSNCGEALDLASALIKLARFAPVHADAGLMTALLERSGSSLNARVERLVAWDETHAGKSGRTFPWYAALPLCGAIFGVVVTYGVVLSAMHEVTEWLVR
jgi:Zn-dependent protease with chaperone function